MSLARSEADARDLTQHAFHMWATKGHQLRDGSKVKTWLYTTLHRAFLSARRRQARFPHEEIEEAAGRLPVVTPEFANHVDSSLVLAALSRVDEVYQAAVALFYLEDCPYKDIAVILDVPIGTVKSRVSRGIAQLREILLTDPGMPDIPQPSRAIRNEPASAVTPADAPATAEFRLVPRVLAGCTP